MPFVQRVVQPVQLSRVLLHDEQGRPRVKDDELEAVTNHTLSSALRQLASVVLLADEIFQDLGKILGDVTERSKRLRVRIAAVDEKASQFDPKAVTVPESDLTIFSSLKEHYKREQCVEKGLFTADSRPVALRRLYEAAAPTPVPVVRQLDRYRRDGLRSSRFFAVTPVMGGKRRRPTKANDMDIETRTPAVVSKLRMWTSLEALGDVTVDPDCTHKIDASAGNDDVDHRLPSPEEQVQAVALKFPAEIVKVDVSGRSFNRMSALRRSLMHVECDDSSRRRHKSRRGRSKRRNTIAGTDTKELAAIVCDSSDTNFGKSTPDSVPCGATISSAEKKSHLESLKEWGRSRLRLIKNSEPAVRLRERSLSSRRKWDKEKDEPHPHSSSGNWSASSESGQSTATSHHPRSSISSGSTCQKHGRRTVMVSTSSSVTSESTLTPDDGETCSMYSCDTEGYYTSFHMDSGLKTLREEDPLPALQSTSALSGSRINSSSLTADSEYELFGKGSTSTTASSAGTVCTTLIIPPPSVPERINSHLSSERNVKSLTNLSSEKTPPLNKEGAYYRTDNKSNTDPCRGRSVSDIKKVETVKSNLTKENVSKLKEQYNDNVQADKNCMIMVEVHHEGGDDKNEKCGDSPDSGHNTCSSPVDSVTSPSLDLEMSECSDLEGVDRVERIRVKTTINSSRIPSMCVITPPQSDDEVSLNAMKTAAVDIGDYVTIADVRHKENAPAAPVPTPVPISPVPTRDTEYVSLNELPSNDSLERKRRQGARVTLDSEGKVVYSSDSLRRRKAIHTTGTFDPGPNVATTSSPVMQHRVINIRPVVTSNSPILRGDRRLASATLTPTTQKIISASQQIISRPLSPLVGSKKNIITESTTTNTLTSKTDTLKKVDNKTVTLTNNQTNTGLVSLVAQRRLSPSNQKQYFPKSSYGNMSPVATSNRPMSPLVLSNNPKITNISNGKRSQTPPTSPVKSPTLSSRPLSPKNVVKANLSRAVSPTSPRGAYVRVKDATGPDDDSKMVKRSDSYRMANDDTKTVFNPNVLGRKQYGAGIVAGPKLLTAIQTVQANKESKTREEGSSAASGGASPPRQWQDTWPQRTPQTDVRSSTPTKPNTPPMNITSTLSPIRSMTPTHSTRSPMDLYAIIHESKKKIMKLKGKQSPEPPTTAPQTSKQVNWPKCIPTTQGKSNMMDQSHEQLKLPSNGQYQRLSPSPTPSTLYVDRGSVVAHPSHSLPRKLNSPPTKIENNLNRYSPTNRSQYSPPQPMPNLPTRNYASLDRKFSPKSNFRQPSSSRSGLPHSTSRNDFKQLLLRTGWSSTSPGKPSAVERLKNNKPAVPAVPSPKRKTWKSDVLSSTILEDCDEADGPSQREVSAILQTARNRPDVAIPKSSALVSQQCKAFQARSSPTLETAL